MDTLTGTLVRLRPLQDSDYEYLAGLKNDLRTQAWNQRLPPAHTAAMMRERYERRSKEQQTGNFRIETMEGAMAGTVGYSEEVPRHAATLGIMIGREHWGKGIAREAMELVLQFLFEERGLQVVRLWTQSGNPRAVRAFEKVGFRLGARLRESAVIGGQVADTLYMDLLREEYYASRGMTDRIAPAASSSGQLSS